MSVIELSISCWKGVMQSLVCSTENRAGQSLQLYSLGFYRLLKYLAKWLNTCQRSPLEDVSTGSQPLPTVLSRSKSNNRTALVAQWISICLLVQGAQVQSLVQEAPTWHGTAKPMCTCCNYGAHVPHLLEPVHLEPMPPNKRSPHERPMHRNKEQSLLAATRESPLSLSSRGFWVPLHFLP